MKSLRTKLTLAFGTLLVLILASVLLLTDRLIQGAYEAQVTAIGENTKRWIEASYKQLGERIAEPLALVATDRDVLVAVTEGHRRNTSKRGLDLLEYGDRDGIILWNADGVGEGRSSEYVALRQPTLKRWAGQKLAILQTLAIESGSEPFGFVTGGYLLYDWLKVSVPPSDSLLFWQTGNQIRPLQGDALSGSQQVELGSSDQVALEGHAYNTVRFPLGDSGGTIIVAVPRDALDAQRTRLRNTLLILALLSIGAVYGFGYLMALGMTRSLGRLSEGARQLAGGDLDVQVPVRTRDEIGLLAERFNQMVTDLKTLQAKLLSTERVAAWRDMAQMLAHEIKNPLFPIQLSVESLQRTFGKRPERFEEIFDDCTETVLEEVQKLRRIVDEFGQFARLPSPELQPCALNDVVEQTIALYAAPPAGVTIQTHLASELPAIQADAQQLGQVCQNLVKNALEAMPEGGILTLRTSVLAADATQDVEAGTHWICLECQDTGIGMSEETQANLFKPYYTTKEQGTGLGMAIVERIVTEHHGFVTLHSQPGQGSTFRICFLGAS